MFLEYKYVNKMIALNLKYTVHWNRITQWLIILRVLMSKLLPLKIFLIMGCIITVSY